MDVLNRSGTTLLVAVLLMAAHPEARTASPAVEEYQVKAAFLYNFAKFVEWPPEAFRGRGDNILICVLGRNPFGAALAEAVKGKSVGSRTFVVQQVSEAQAAAGCHILFVGNSERRQLESLLQAIRSPYMLTVGESEDFIANGGLINFVLRDSTVRFQVNAEAVGRSSLRVSSKLLSIAEGAKQ